VAHSEHPSIEELRALVLFADTGSVSEAAERLGVKQPVASVRLKVFRKGEPLLRTRGNQVEITDKGQAALPAIRELLRRYDHLKQYLAGKREAPNVLRVATGSSGSQYYLPRALAIMRKRQPDWEIETQVARGERRILAVAEGAVDLAIVSHDALQIEMTLHSRYGNRLRLEVSQLARQPLCVIGRKDSLEAGQLQVVLRGQQVPLKMLCRWRLVGLDRQSGVRRQIEQKFATSKQRPQFGGEVGGWLAVKEYARQGLGVGLVPLALMSREDATDFVIRLLSSEVFIQYSLIHRSQPDAGNAGLDALQAALHESAAQHQAELDRRWSGKV
jgi:DNA-binding transcriptional LysR family regulator